MRIVGHRNERPIAFSASAELLLEGCRFNDELHRMPSGSTGFMPKGIFRFKTHTDANQHQQACLIAAMARLAWERGNG